MIRFSRVAFAFTGAVLVAAIVLIGVQRAEAFSFTQTGSLSGTGVSVPVDLDGNATTCATVGGVTTCPDDSFTSIYSGRAIGPFGGPFTGQNVSEAAPVSGTGCLFAPTTIQSCTLGTVTNACEYQYVNGGSGANVFTATNSVLPYTITGGTLCLDTSSFPLHFAGTNTISVSGGTGNFTGVTGSGTVTFTGQTTSADPAGHGFSWDTGTFTETLTK